MADLEGTSYYVAVSEIVTTAVKFDINNIGAPQIISNLGAKAHHACSQAITNFVATTFWFHAIQIFDPTNGTVLAFFAPPSQQGPGIIAINDGPSKFVIDGEYTSGNLVKYSDSDLSLISSTNFPGFEKLKSLALIPGTSFFTFG